MQVDVLTMPSTAVTNADITSCKTALELLDNSVDGNYLNVNMNLAGTDCPSGNGTAATSQRVTIASDSTGQVKLAASSGVDIGKLTANQSVNNAQINGVTPLMGNGVTGTGSQRVTIASDNTAFQVLTTSAITGIGHGVKVVTTAGTDVALAASTACKKVTIQAMNSNTGVIAVGTSGVDATLGTGTGIILYANDAFEFEIDNLADVYIDATVSGNSVRFTYFT
jgi:hypothetical protein